MFATNSSSTRTVLVLGGTGLMGREVLAALARRGAPARVMVRNPGKLVSRDGLDVRIGDLRDPASLRAAIAGVDVVFHISPHESDEVALTRGVIDACEAEGARLVFAGVHVLAENPIAGWFNRTLFGLLLPRYRGKIAIGAMVERSATNPVVLAVSNFMQNDQLMLPSIRDGVFAHPCSPKGLNRVDLRDLGDIAASILLDPTFPSGSYPVVGPRSLTGPECAQVWAEALGHPVRYLGDDDMALDAAIDRHVSGYRAEDFRSSMRKLRTLPWPTLPKDLAVTTRLLGRAPTDFSEFVRRVVAEQSAHERIRR